MLDKTGVIFVSGNECGRLTLLDEMALNRYWKIGSSWWLSAYAYIYT